MCPLIGDMCPLIGDMCNLIGDMCHVMGDMCYHCLHSLSSRMNLKWQWSLMVLVG